MNRGQSHRFDAFIRKLVEKNSADGEIESQWSQYFAWRHYDILINFEDLRELPIRSG